MKSPSTTGRYAFGAFKLKKSSCLRYGELCPLALTDYRLRNANILLITMRALSNEIAKNIVLAGIGSLTIQDDQLVKEEDLGAQFLISEGDIGKNVRGIARWLSI